MLLIKKLIYIIIINIITLNTMRTSVIYCRISTYNQKFGYSLDLQNHICTEYCKNNKFNIINNVYEIGRATNIKNLKKLINIIENNNNINIIIQESTRLCRNINDYNNIINICKKNNIIIHSVTNNIITNNINSIIELMNHVKQGELESLILSKRVKKNIEYRKMMNTFVPSIAKFGYMFDYINNQKCLIINKKEELIIKLVNKLYYNQRYKHILIKINKKIKCLVIKKKSISNIAKSFNENKIFNRNKFWNYNSIKSLIIK